jgi:iron complex transport system substrate-binding protein
MKFKFFIYAFVLLTTSLSAQQRIITAGSSSTEIVCALGLTDRIIATDKTSYYPDKMQTLPSIGYRNSISVEGIISLKPDLVVFEKEYVSDELIAQLKSTGIKTLVVDHGQNFESTTTRIRVIAAAVNKKPEAEKLVAGLESDLAVLKKKVDATSVRPTVLCVYARGGGNMQVAGKNTSFGLLPLSGVVNALAEIEGYKPLNAESLIQANPDYILFFNSGLQSIGGIEEVLKIAGVAQTTAGKKRQIISMDGILLTNWGPRVAIAAEQLFQLTHPESLKP